MALCMEAFTDTLPIVCNGFMYEAFSDTLPTVCNGFKQQVHVHYTPLIIAQTSNLFYNWDICIKDASSLNFLHFFSL